MYKVIIDCVSVKELKDIAEQTGVNLFDAVWAGAEFESHIDAELFAGECRIIAHGACVTIE